jgi:DNA-binding transcriptional LysR family regulator
MDARQLEYFLAVVDEGSVRAAATRLFVAQPSVSQSIKTLERDLEAELFHRSGRRLVLTPAGEALITPARQVLHWLDLSRAHVDAVNGLRQGVLVLATMPSQAVAPLAPIITKFVSRYPLIQISLKAASTVTEALSVVRAGGAELAIVASLVSLELEDLVAHPLGRQRFIGASPPTEALAEGRSVSFEQLEGQRLIAGQKGTGMRRVADNVIAANESTSISVETEHREAILPLVLAGAGVAILSEAWRDLCREAGLHVYELMTNEELEVFLVHRRTALAPAAQAFLMQALPGHLSGSRE